MWLFFTIVLILIYVTLWFGIDIFDQGPEQPVKKLVVRGLPFIYLGRKADLIKDGKWVNAKPKPSSVLLYGRGVYIYGYYYREEDKLP